GGGAGQRRRAFERVQATACRGRRRGVARRAEVERVTDECRMVVEEIAVERDDRARTIEAVQRLERLAVSEPCAGEDVVAVYRLPLVPAGVRITPEKGHDLGVLRQRGDHGRQESHSRPTVRSVWMETRVARTQTI